jgi:hypothetical protein
MAKIEWNRIPKFAQLPVNPEAPPQSSWRVFGDDDQLSAKCAPFGSGVITGGCWKTCCRIFGNCRVLGEKSAIPPPLLQHAVRDSGSTVERRGTSPEAEDWNERRLCSVLSGTFTGS